MHVDNSSPSTAPTLLTPRQLRLLQVGSTIEDAPGMPVAYAARLWAQLSLPYRDPGDTPEWVRHNGALTLSLTPGIVTQRNGDRIRAYPYGVIPRYALTWMATEAVRTRSPHLDMGSLSHFLNKLGMNSSGASGRRALEQVRRLITASINIEDRRTSSEGRWSLAGMNFHIVQSYQLEFSADEIQSAGVTLSDEFFKSVIDSPVPLRQEALRALAGSPMRLDLYVWLIHRLYALRTPSTVSWAQLMTQFGADYAVPRQFKAAFLRCFREVQIIYPEANVVPLDSGLRLAPSPKHIKPRFIA
jgi:Plasmid encoded RepA protein